jgi:hypothetical protein
VSGHIEDAMSVDWGTPKFLVDASTEVFGGKIDLDPCSNEHSIVGARFNFILPEHDGLVDPWDEVDGQKIESIFVNPPYGRTHMHKVTKEILSAKEWKKIPKAERIAYKTTTIKHWIQRCWDYGSKGLEVIALIPAAVDTKHWQFTIFPTAQRICWLSGRLKFILPNGGKNSAPMACALCYWGDLPGRFDRVFGELGEVTIPSAELARSGILVAKAFKKAA